MCHEASGLHRISTHAPAGGATTVRTVSPAPMKFLLTPLREGRRHLPYVTYDKTVFLLTPLREGRRSESGHQARGEDISTHAPAGGATFFERLKDKSIPISTHAPAGGATFATLMYEVNVYSISTHAPAGGATTSLTM